MSHIPEKERDWIFSVFYNMPDDELAKELRTVKSALGLYLGEDFDIYNSFVCEYLEELFEIERDALVLRFIHNYLPFDSEDSVKVDG